MGVIGINEVLFPMSVSRMTRTGNAIDGSINSWVSQGEKSTAFSKFVEDYGILQDILSEYKNLVLKDVATINRVGSEVMRTDAMLAGIWRP